MGWLESLSSNFKENVGIKSSSIQLAVGLNLVKHSNFCFPNNHFLKYSPPVTCDVYTSQSLKLSCQGMIIKKREEFVLSEDFQFFVKCFSNLERGFFVLLLENVVKSYVHSQFYSSTFYQGNSTRQLHL